MEEIIQGTRLLGRSKFYLRTTCIQNILHIKQPVWSFKKERLKTVYRTENLEVDLSVVQFISCVQHSGGRVSVRKRTASAFLV